MHVQKTQKSDTEVVLNISATEEDLAPIKQKILSKLAKNVKVAGFRSGHVPLQVAEKHIDASLLQTEFLDEAMTEFYNSAIQTENIRPVTQPKVDLKKFVPFTTLEFDVTSEVFGEIKLGKYKGLKSTVSTKKVTPKDVEGVLETLQTRMSERVNVDRAVKLGDEVLMDFKGQDSKGEPINGADGADYPLIIGSNAFIPGFEDNLIGMKNGDNKSFTLTFPKDYGVKALASKKVTFTVTIKKVTELKKAKLDDDFAAKAGPFKSLNDLKKDITLQLEQEAANDTEKARHNELVEKVVEASEVALPKSAVEQQIIYEIDEIRRNLTYRGQTYQEYLKMEGTDEETYKKEVVEPRARKQVKTSVILSEIARVEELEVTAEELEMQMQALKSQYKDPQMQAELDKPESRQDIAGRILTQKVLNLLVQNAS